MIKSLRKKKTQKTIWIIISAAVGLSFIIWGVPSSTRNKQEVNFVGRIGGRKIPSSEYQDALYAARNQAIMRYGQDKFSEIQKSLNLQSQAWERLVLLAEVKKRNIKVNDKEVVDLIQGYPFFQSSKGQFDNQIYAQTLRYLFQTPPRAFEEQIRQNLAIYKLYEEVTDKISVTDDEVRQEYRKATEEISIYYTAAISSDFNKDITVSGEQLKDYFAKNPLQFKQPFSFNIEYVSLDSENKDPKKIEADVIKIMARLKKKELFDKVAKDNGLAIKETGLFKETDPIPGIGWSPQILNLIAKAKSGEYLTPIQMDKAYYILKLKEKKNPYIPEFETIKEQVKEVFTREETQKIALQKMENCLKKLKELYDVDPKTADFNKTAPALGLKAGSTELFKYGSYIEGIGASETFWSVAQKLKEGQISGIINVPPDFYIIKLKTKVPIDEEKFLTAKKEYSEILLTQKKQEYFVKFIIELKSKTEFDFKG